MDKTFRRLFNAAFTDSTYKEYQSDLSRSLNVSFGFRLAETPVFIPEDLRRRLIEASGEILGQLCEPARLRKMMRAIPARWHVPHMDRLPSFAQLDFAVVRGADNELAPKLIELQGFPSLTALQIFQCDAWGRVLRKTPGLDLDWSCWFSALNRSGFLDLARRTILGSNAPENVVLMDIDPPSQKTYPDFAATRLLFGVDSVCPTSLVREGRRLFRRIEDGRARLVPVHRIYHRVVFDELERKGIQLPFDYREELEVEWAPHPNWFWVWSKFSLPFLNHPAVPKATILSQLEEIPEDLENRYVLKPLFSFAGSGVLVEPKPEDVHRIPSSQREGWCLQEKIRYEPALQSAEGAGVKVEIRLMFLRPDDQECLLLAQNLCRLSRGSMLGVDFNKSFSWVGASVGLWPFQI